MKILLLMAGKAERFKKSKYKEYKPLIKVGAKRVVDWTLESLGEFPYKDLYIAVHDSNADDLINHFGQKYRLSLNQVCVFPNYTSGNLETAYQACRYFEFNENESILILDCDNYYNGLHVLDACKQLSQSLISGAICTFDPIDKSEKWCFAHSDKYRHVLVIQEKKNDIRGRPMVGVFWFRKIANFLGLADIVMMKKMGEEVYMSDAVKELIEAGHFVKDIRVDQVVPLGTPEDIDNANLH